MCKQLGGGGRSSPALRATKTENAVLSQITILQQLPVGVTGREHPAQSRLQEWWGPLHMHHPVLEEQALSRTQQETGLCFQPHSPGDMIENGQM